MYGGEVMPAHFSYTAGGWGMGILVAAYTVVYIRAICVNNRARP